MVSRACDIVSIISYSYLLTPDLGPPLVTVITEGSSIAGEIFSMICTVETVEGVRSNDISIIWTGPDETIISGDDRIMIIGPNTDDIVTTGILMFSLLYTSDRGQYTCTGRISATSVGVDVSDDSSVDINVTSKY